MVFLIHQKHTDYKALILLRVLKHVTLQKSAFARLLMLLSDVLLVGRCVYCSKLVDRYPQLFDRSPETVFPSSLILIRFLDFSCLLAQHWIRIELHPDLLIQRLTMTVDPSDSSYMPSVVVISAGDSIQSLKEIKTVHISATDSVVTLLEDAKEVRGFFYADLRYGLFFFLINPSFGGAGLYNILFYALTVNRWWKSPEIQ